MRILLAVDGSPVATRAARFVAKLSPTLKEKPQVVLPHADEPLLRSVAIELGVQGLAKYHAGNSKFALKTAKAVLNRADVADDEEMLVGNPAETIVKSPNPPNATSSSWARTAAAPSRACSSAR